MKPTKLRWSSSLPSHSVNKTEAQGIYLPGSQNWYPAWGTGTQASQVHADKHSHPTPPPPHQPEDWGPWTMRSSGTRNGKYETKNMRQNMRQKNPQTRALKISKANFFILQVKSNLIEWLAPIVHQIHVHVSSPNSKSSAHFHWTWHDDISWSGLNKTLKVSETG